MDTTSTVRRPKNRWTNNPHQVVPPDPARALRGMRGTRGGPLGAALAAFRTAGWGVPALAVAVAMNPAAVAQQICRARRAGRCCPPGLDIPVPELTAEQHPAAYRGTWPNPPLPPLAAEHLRELHARARWGHGNTGHPRQLASAHLAEDIKLLLDRGYRKVRIKTALGVTYRLVDYLLERHGHRPPTPSATGRRRRLHP